MTISLEQIGKRFKYDWIFRNIDYTFYANNHYALLGNNGSGKSTLLRIIAGMQSPSKGNISWKSGNDIIKAEQIYKHISFSAPAMDIIEEMSLREFLSFHFSFKKTLLPINEIIKIIDLENSESKYIKDFSSGMKQRLKLAQAFFSDAAVLLLDEPCSNLDKAGISLYQQLMHDYTNDRIVIIASNDEQEYFSAQHLIQIREFK